MVQALHARGLEASQALRAQALRAQALRFWDHLGAKRFAAQVHHHIIRRNLIMKLSITDVLLAN